MISIDVQEELFNPVYYPFLGATARIQIFYGGASSGKSVFLAQRCISDVMGGYRNYLVVRSVGRTLRTSVFNELKKVIRDWEVGTLFRVNETEMTFTCANGNQIILRGLDDVEKMKSVTCAKGVITDIWIEEATETTEDSFMQLTKRLRGIAQAKKRITLSFNPINRTHWIYKKFFPSFNDELGFSHTNDILILRTTHLDNKFLTVDDRDALEKETNEYYYDVYTKGKWGILGHLIFTNWRVENLTGRRDAFGTYLNGLDFGFTNDPTFHIRCAIKDNTVYITHEMYDFGLTNKAIYERVHPVIQNEVIRCDPSEPKSIQELRERGLNAMRAKGGPGSVNHGIQFLQGHQIVVHNTLQGIINELGQYQWDKNKDGEIMNVPVDRDNHGIDAWRYAVSAVSLRQKPDKRGKFEPAALGLR